MQKHRFPRIFKIEICSEPYESNLVRNPSKTDTSYYAVLLRLRVISLLYDTSAGEPITSKNAFQL